MTERTGFLELGPNDLAYYRFSCELFPNPESPLREVRELSIEDAGPAYHALHERGLVEPSTSLPAAEVTARLTPVSECEAKVSMATMIGGAATWRDFYVASGWAVEYSRAGDAHAFGEPLPEDTLGKRLVEQYRPADTVAPTLRLSAGDYLVFAVFARDVRDAEEGAADTMSLEEVLAHFDEPETKYVRTPDDDAWQQSVMSLFGRGILVREGDAYALDARFHSLARELVADHNAVVSRIDFLDDQWLVRELCLYPTADSVYRVGTEADGSVAIEELTRERLLEVVLAVVCTLPNLLEAETPLSIKLKSQFAARV